MTAPVGHDDEVEVEGFTGWLGFALGAAIAVGLIIGFVLLMLGALLRLFLWAVGG